MSFADFQHRIVLSDDFSIQDRATILEVMQVIYGTPSGKEMFDEWFSLPYTLKVEYGRGKFGATADVSITLDLEYVSNAKYISNDGTAFDWVLHCFRLFFNRRFNCASFAENLCKVLREYCNVVHGETW